MKKILLIFITGMSLFSSINAQLLFQEGFTSPFNPATNGWSVQNLSAVANPTISWTQGTSNTFPSYDGGPNDYYSCNFLTTNSGSPVTLSVWLITPTLTIIDGSIIKFATRTTNNPSNFADRLEVYLSTAGNGTNVGTTPSSLGTFSILLTSVNPSLTSTGYPGSWTVYSATISGVPSAIPGRIGFRYHVTNAGPSPNATNGDYIGLDAVQYYGPCSVTVPSFTTCASSNVTITALDANSTNSFTWYPGGINNTSIVVSPSVNTTYTLVYTTNGRICPDEISTVTIGNQLNINLSSSNNPVCYGSSVTLTAISPATSYTWINSGAQTASIVTTLTSSTIFTVMGSISSPSCIGSNTFQVNVYPTTTINSVVAPAKVCVGKTYSVAVWGALSFFWYDSTGFISPYPKISTTPTIAGIHAFTVVSIDNNGCSISKTLSVLINPTPTVSILTPTLICVNAPTTFSATGASTYSWKGLFTSTVNPVTAVPLSTGFFSLSATGVNSFGCSNISFAFVQVVGPTLSISSPSLICLNESAVLNASGALSYTWNGAQTSTTNPYTVTPTQSGSYSISVSGVDANGCINNKTANILVNICEGFKDIVEEDVLVYPNPFQNYIKIEGVDLVVTVYDAFGRVVLNKINVYKTTIETSSFPAGSYMICIIDNKGKIIGAKKILKD